MGEGKIESRIGDMFFRGKEIPISESDYVSVAMPPVIDKPFGEMTKK